MSKTVSVKTPTPLIHLLLLLSATTGMVDAASILGMGKVFTANMTGNVVFLAFSAAGAPGFQPMSYLIALGTFMVGATFAGRLWRMPGPQHLRHWLIVAALIEATLLMFAGVAPDLEAGQQFSVVSQNPITLTRIATTTTTIDSKNLPQ